MHLGLLDFAERTRDAQSASELYQLFRGAVAEVGWTFSVVGATSFGHCYSQALPPAVPMAPVMFADYPVDWARHYLAKDYAQIDPILELMPAAWGPVRWDSIAGEGITAAQRLLLSEAADAGLRHGLSIPVRGPGRDLFVVSLAAPKMGARDLDQLAPYLQLCSLQFFGAIDVLVRRGEKRVRFGPRERECLLWSAQGKSAWEISVILGLSENTVRYYLKTCLHKLGTTNKVIGVVKAIKLGLIDP